MPISDEIAGIDRQTRSIEAPQRGGANRLAVHDWQITRCSSARNGLQTKTKKHIAMNAMVMLVSSKIVVAFDPP